MKKVYIVNKSSHDFSAAQRHGDLIALSEGSMNRYGTNSIHRNFSEKMEDSTKDDYILLCGLTVMNVIAASIFVAKHGKLNLLMFRGGDYIERNIVFKNEKEE